MSNEEQKIEKNDYKDNAPVKNEDGIQDPSVIDDTNNMEKSSEENTAPVESTDGNQNAASEQNENKDETTGEAVILDKKEVVLEEKKKGFFSWLGSAIIDQAVAVGITYILVFLIGIILPSFGYKISNRIMMVFVVYVIINIIYNAVFNNKTVGRKIFL